MPTEKQHCTFKQVPNELIAISTSLEDYDYGDATLLAEDNQAAIEFLDGMIEPVFWIMDTQGTLSISDLMVSASAMARVEVTPWKHPNVRELIIVNKSPMIHLAAKGMNTATFGNFSIAVFDTLDKGIAYARSKLAG